MHRLWSWGGGGGYDFVCCIKGELKTSITLHGSAKAFHDNVFFPRNNHLSIETYGLKDIRLCVVRPVTCPPPLQEVVLEAVWCIHQSPRLNTCLSVVPLSLTIQVLYRTGRKHHAQWQQSSQWMPCKSHVKLLCFCWKLAWAWGISSSIWHTPV